MRSVSLLVVLPVSFCVATLQARPGAAGDECIKKTQGTPATPYTANQSLTGDADRRAIPQTIPGTVPHLSVERSRRLSLPGTVPHQLRRIVQSGARVFCVSVFSCVSAVFANVSTFVSKPNSHLLRKVMKKQTLRNRRMESHKHTYIHLYASATTVGKKELPKSPYPRIPHSIREQHVGEGSSLAQALKRKRRPDDDFLQRTA